MSNNSIENTFLYFTALSIILHVALFALIVYFPPEQKVYREEPYMVELRDLPADSVKAAPEKKEVRRYDQLRRRFPQEIAPRGEAATEKMPAAPSPAVPQASSQPRVAARVPERPAERGTSPQQERQTGDFFKRREQSGADIPKLFPSAQELARLEEGYRRKYESEVEEGETRFLNTDDLQFGSFLRRFESAIYGVWRYPPEAARMGIEGVTPVRITFGRRGGIEKIELLESSGSRMLDDEVRRTLKQVGPIGPFPRGYSNDTFNLIAFFHYRIISGQIQGTLH